MAKCLWKAYRWRFSCGQRSLKALWLEFRGKKTRAIVRTCQLVEETAVRLRDECFWFFFSPLRNRHHVVRLHAPQAVSFRTHFFPLSLGEMDYLSFIFHYGTKIKQYSLYSFSSLERFGSPVSRTAIQDIKCTGCVLSRACFLPLACFPTVKLLPCVQTDE